MSNPIEQADRIMAYLTGELSVEEARRMEQEMMHDKELAQTVKQLRDKDYVTCELVRLRSFDTERGLQRLRQETAVRHSGWRRWLAAAAVVAFVSGAAVFWYRDYMEVTPIEIPQEVAMAMQESRTKGRTGAEITKEAKPDRITAAIEKLGMPEDVKQELLQATRVQTFVDKEYWVTLPDGTLVHLANGSRLIYPERFRGTTRDIYIEGEAYLMVAKSKGNRFVVHTEHGDVTEYGTEFDVDTRSGTGTRVVLVEGSISVKPIGGQAQMIAPGEQAEFASGVVQVSKTDTAPYTAWNTGKVEFKDWTLERLMGVIAKWYHMEVTYDAQGMRAIRVSGNFDRYDDIRPTVEALADITGLKMKIEGEKIVISE